jgi:hypothetical protein
MAAVDAAMAASANAPASVKRRDMRIPISILVFV